MLPGLISLLWALVFGRDNWGTAILQETCRKLSPQITAAVPNLRYVLLISLLISCFDVSLSITCDLSDVQFVYSKTEDLTLVTTRSLERGNTSGKLNSKYWQMLYYRPHRGIRRKNHWGHAVFMSLNGFLGVCAKKLLRNFTIPKTWLESRHESVAKKVGGLSVAAKSSEEFPGHKLKKITQTRSVSSQRQTIYRR